MVPRDLHYQPSVARDFLGLGNLASSPAADEFRGQDDDDKSRPGFESWSFAGSPHVRFVRSDLTNIKNPLWNEHMNVQKVFNLGNSAEERFLEGTADSCPALQTALVLPGVLPTNAQSRPLGSNQGGAQLTIFYGGSVNVYDNVSSGKAQAIMQAAAGLNCPPVDVAVIPTGERQARKDHLYFNDQICPARYVADEASQSSPPVNKYEYPQPPSTPSSDSTPLQPMVPKALPLARKASLVRFLEKRKERMQMMAPYLKKNAMASGNSFTGANYCGSSSMPYSVYAVKSTFMTSGGEYPLQPVFMPSVMNDQFGC